MKLLYKETLIFALTIVIVDGANWYYATINTNGGKNHYEPTENNNFSVQGQYQSKDDKNNNLKGILNILPEYTRLQPKDNTGTIVNMKSSKIKTKISSENQRNKERFLNVFQVVQFEHNSCTSRNGLDGTCLPEQECTTLGGTDMGNCADGFGTCCVNIFLCDGDSAALSGWLTNSDFPSPSSERLSCVFTLDKSSKEITQIRLDFFNFELLPPFGGLCQEDQFAVSGQNNNHYIPIICGINTGQHMYIEVSDSDGPIFLSMQTISPQSRLFSIKVTQLKIGDDLTAPTGCLQYLKEDEGSFESFNYKEESKIGLATRPSYLNNLNYAICIKRAAETCSVTYSNGGDMQIINYDTDGLPVIPPYQAGVEIFNCPSDWLLISATRLCGDRLNDGSVIQDFSLNAPVIDENAGPIVIWFRTDEGYVGRGFKLQYKQNPCQNP